MPPWTLPTLKSIFRPDDHTAGNKINSGRITLLWWRTVCLWNGSIPQKVFPTFGNIFHVYLICKGIEVLRYPSELRHHLFNRTVLTGRWFKPCRWENVLFIIIQTFIVFTRYNGFLCVCWFWAKSLDFQDPPPRLWNSTTKLTYVRNWITMIASWASCKINSTAKSMQPIRQHFLPRLGPKRHVREYNFLHIFEIPSSIRLEKQWEMLKDFCDIPPLHKNTVDGGSHWRNRTLSWSKLKKDDLSAQSQVTRNKIQQDYFRSHQSLIRRDSFRLANFSLLSSL